MSMIKTPLAPSCRASRIHIGLISLLCLCLSPFLMAADQTIEVYKSAYCGCCKDWLKHLEANGFKVISHDVENLNAIKMRAGLKREQASCHTGFINGYVIEGHVPAQDIQRLLNSKANIKGLTVPGMPAGMNVPGMEVEGKQATYDVLAISHEGDTEVWQHYE